MMAGGQNIARIRVGLMRLFGLEIDKASGYLFREATASRYYHHRSEILRKIIYSPVVYIDETGVNQRSEAGYV
jgi:hypothetical protein